VLSPPALPKPGSEFAVASSETTATAKNSQDQDPQKIRAHTSRAQINRAKKRHLELNPELPPAPELSPDEDHQLDAGNESSDLESKESSDPEDSNSSSGSQENNEVFQKFQKVLQCPGTLNWGEVPPTRPEENFFPSKLPGISEAQSSDLVPDGPDQAMSSFTCTCHGIPCHLPCVCHNKCICHPDQKATRAKRTKRAKRREALGGCQFY